MWLAYCTEAYRPLRRARPLRFVVLPLAVTVACCARLLPVDGALPWTRAERVVVLAIVDYVLVTHHFAAQHFGALSLYRARVGNGGGARARRRDWLFALGVGGVLVLVADVLAGAVAYQDLWVDRWLAPAWIAAAEHEIRVGALTALIVGTVAMLAMELRATRPSLPRILYVVGIAGMVAVALRPRSPFLFLVLWTSQHWIVAVGLTSLVPRREHAPKRGGMRWALHALNTRPAAVVLLLVATSVLLLPAFEVEASLDTGVYYSDRIFGAFAMQLRESAWVPILMALGFSTGFTHYLLDRSVFRLSDRHVRAAARGLVQPSTPPTSISRLPRLYDPATLVVPRTDVPSASSSPIGAA